MLDKNRKLFSQLGTKTFCWKKLQIFFFRKMSHSAEKCKRGTIWDLLTYILLQNIKKFEGGPFGDIKKFLIKCRTVPKKNRKPISLVPFCRQNFKK